MFMRYKSEYVFNTCVIVYLLQYLVSVILISETMKTRQHQEVDSECLYIDVVV
jgi:hypothetical protein